MADKKQVLVELKSGIRQRQSSNAVLDVELRDLNVAVNERRHIDEVNGIIFFHLKICFTHK